VGVLGAEVMRGAGEAGEGEEEELGRLHAGRRGSSPRNELQRRVKEVAKAPTLPRTLGCRLA